MLSNLEKNVFSLLRKIPRGRVSTYKVLAFKIDKPNCPRLIGKILAKNFYPQKYPCYKIVKSNGEIGGYSRGTKKKIELLQKDGVRIKKNKIVNFEKYIFNDFNN